MSDRMTESGESMTSLISILYMFFGILSLLGIAAPLGDLLAQLSNNDEVKTIIGNYFSDSTNIIIATIFLNAYCWYIGARYDTKTQVGALKYLPLDEQPRMGALHYILASLILVFFIVLAIIAFSASSQDNNSYFLGMIINSVKLSNNNLFYYFQAILFSFYAYNIIGWTYMTKVMYKGKLDKSLTTIKHMTIPEPDQA